MHNLKGISQTLQSTDNQAGYQYAYLWTTHCNSSPPAFSLSSINTATETPRMMMDFLDFCSELQPECNGPTAFGNGEGITWKSWHQPKGKSETVNETGNSSPHHHDQVSYTSKQWFGASDMEIIVEN